MTAEGSILLHALAEGLEGEERMILCGFRGDPNAVNPTKWRPRPWKPGRDLPFDAQDNVYVAVASFGKAQDGSYRRRVDTFQAGRALMVDDVGTKVDRAVVAHLPPTARIETSPDNEQWWYLLDKPLRDVSRFDAVIRAFISSNLLGADPGMAGVNRVGRLPGFTNGKPKYHGFRVRTLDIDVNRRFTVEQLAEAFKLNLQNGRRYHTMPERGSEELKERARMWGVVAARLRDAGLFKRDDFDPSGWLEMRCPWIDGHTNGADTGAAIRQPNDENGWYGAFRCHHGHCADKGWGDLTEWLAEQDAEDIENANRQEAIHGEFHPQD